MDREKLINWELMRGKEKTNLSDILFFVLVPGSLMKDAMESDIDLRRPNDNYKLTKIREQF